MPERSILERGQLGMIITKKAILITAGIILGAALLFAAPAIYDVALRALYGVKPGVTFERTVGGRVAGGGAL